jgi:hypothetical protein
MCNKKHDEKFDFCFIKFVKELNSFVNGFNDKRSKLNSDIIKNVAWLEISSCVEDTDFNC